MKTATKTAAAPPAAAPAPAPTAKPAGLKKVNLGGIAATKADTTRTVYPTVPDPDGEIALLVADILAETEQFDALEGSLKMKKGELTSRTAPFYFNHSHGKAEIPSSIEAFTKPEDPKEARKSVLVQFQNRYTPLDDEAMLTAALGEENVAAFFRQSFSLKVDGDLIPEDNANELIGEVQAIFEKYNATAALTAKSIIKPTKEFHAARHTKLTVDENLAVQKIIPIVAAVKTKGRKAA